MAIDWEPRLRKCTEVHSLALGVMAFALASNGKSLNYLREQQVAVN